MTRTARKAKKKYEEPSSWSDMIKLKTQNKGVVNKSKGSILKSSEVVDEKRLRRREDRRKRRARSKVCFKCRQPGHTLFDCPSNESRDSICFKCGSTEHTVKNCKKIVLTGSYPFAKCFICQEMGHLSSACPDNPKGLYPNGGGCKFCGSVEHLKSNCPIKQKQSKSGTLSVHVATNDAVLSADADIIDQSKLSSSKPNHQQQNKKQKIVKF